MGVVTGFHKARMLAIEAAAIVQGVVVGDNLILTSHDGTDSDAGNVRGPQGIQGIPGIVTVSHGANPAIARPAAAIVHWVGVATPVNAIATDFLTRATI